MDLPLWIPEPTNRVSLGGLSLMHGGPAGMHLPEHEHPEVQLGLHFPATRQHKRAPIDVLPAYFTLIPSGKPHRGGWSIGSEVIVVHFSQSLIEQASNELLRNSLSEVLAQSCASDPVLQGMGYALLREFKSGGITDLLYAESIGIVLTRHLVRQWTFLPQPRIMKGKLTAGQLRKTFDAIEEDLKNGPTISALASALDMGTHHFTRLFGRSTGTSPYQFIVRRRLTHACHLLKTTRMSLTDIALELGFVSHSHFTSVFRHHYGTPPSVYRLRAKN